MTTRVKIQRGLEYRNSTKRSKIICHITRPRLNAWKILFVFFYILLLQVCNNKTFDIISLQTFGIGNKSFKTFDFFFFSSHTEF